jgi:hypothetical protein
VSDVGVRLGVGVREMAELVADPPDGKLFNDFVVP